MTHHKRMQNIYLLFRFYYVNLQQIYDTSCRCKIFKCHARDFFTFNLKTKLFENKTNFIKARWAFLSDENEILFINLIVK